MFRLDLRSLSALEGVMSMFQSCLTWDDHQCILQEMLVQRGHAIRDPAVSPKLRLLGDPH